MSGPVEQHRFLGSMGCVVIWGPSRNCAEICGDCERGLDPAVVIPPEASSTPIISSESLAAKDRELASKVLPQYPCISVAPDYPSGGGSGQGL